MNLATRYLGLELRSPFVVGASPFCDSAYLACKLQDAGAGALVMRSLFEEQLTPRRNPSRTLPMAEGLGDCPEFADYQLSPEDYVRQVAYLKENVTIPVIASLNGTGPGAWTDFAPRLERAGADAIELNLYRVVTDVGVAADEVETDMLKAVGHIASQVSIPVIVKLSPFHTSIAQLAVALELAGAAGVVLFNRFYQTDINTQTLELETRLRLSASDETLLRLRWLAILSPQLRGTLAAAGGFQTADDAVKAVLSGAHAVQIVSVLLRSGPTALTDMIQGMLAWMSGHGFGGIDAFRGSLSARSTRDPAAAERAGYLRTLQGWKV